MSTLLLSLLGPVVIGPLTFLLMQGLKAGTTLVDGLPPLAKRLVVAGIAMVITLVASLTGVPIHCDVQADVNCLTMLDHDTVKAVVAAGVAFLLHALKGAVKKKD